MNSLKRITSVGALLIITGCTTLPEASPELKRQAESFAPPPGKAAVYVASELRHQGANPEIFVGLQLDQIDFGTLAPGMYLYGTVRPGEHFIFPPTAGGKGVRFLAEAGKNYFFLTKTRFSLRFAPMSEEKGRAWIKQLAPSGINRFENSE